MRHVLILGFLAGCTCADQDDGSRDLSVPRLAPAMPPEPGLPPQAPRSAAPVRTLWGLGLGATDEAGLGAWVESRSIDCEALTSPRRMTRQLRCTLADLPPEMATRRPGEAQTLLILARPDEGPLHHVSTLRHHPEPEAAIADFSAASEQITVRLGAATRTSSAAPTQANLSGAHARFVSTWSFSDLEVELSLSKMGGQALVVRERWDVPGVEAGVVPRPGSVGHSAGSSVAPHSPHGIVPAR